MSIHTILRLSTHHRSMLIAIAIGLWVPVEGLVGQESDLRAACKAAKQTVLQRRSGVGVSQALSNLQVCPDLAATVFASLWESPPRDSATLRLLGQLSGRIDDAVLFNAVRAAVLDGERPRPERAAALQALVQFCDPKMELWFRELHTQGARVIVAYSTGDVTRGVGPTGPPPHACASVTSSLESIADGDRDPVMRAFAQRATDTIRRTRPRP